MSRTDELKEQMVLLLAERLQELECADFEINMKYMKRISDLESNIKISYYDFQAP